MNKEVGICVLLLMLICLISATGAGFWQNKYEDISKVPFIPPDNLDMTQPSLVEQSPVWVAFTSFWSFIIIYQVLIPISLYVTIELIKIMQVYHIQCDEHFFDENTGTSIKCRALNIPEELGQVEYIFADKTGTLTENDMVFRRCSINCQDFEHTPLDPQLIQVKPLNKVVPNAKLQEKLHAVEFKHVFDTDGKRSVSMSEECQRLHDFFFVLAACNTVVVSKRAHRDTMTASGLIIPPEDEIEQVTPTRSIIGSFRPRIRNLLSIPRLSPISSPAATPLDTPRESPKNSPHFSVHQHVSYKVQDNSSQDGDIVLKGFKSESKGYQRPDDLPVTRLEQILSTPEPRPLTAKPFYEAESPDELALVEAAYAYGVQLMRRNLTSVLVSMPGTGNLEYEVLHVLPFDSNRKRMSIIVKDPDTNETILYCKGADCAITENLRRCRSFNEQRRLESLNRHLGSYARIGLRVLCMSKRVLSDEVYDAWSQKLLEVENAVTPNREIVLQTLYNEIETGLELLGATGIEDKLQDGVPQTISALRKAGIVVCVLTGDKQETAINIAYSCSLFNSDMQILKLCASTKRETEEVMHRFLSQAEQEDGITTDYPLDSGRKIPLRRKRGLVVDGRTLVYILDIRANLRNTFLSLAIRCTAILCCRATPLQKALVVKLTKDKLKALCLAVGDGANDVSMIQTADVGVGISGVEGRQAVMASDYAISRFRHLERLLLVHGHWCYERLAKTVLYFFYKNCSFVFLLLFYQLYCGYSGSLMIEQMYLIAFNLLFTSLPPLAIGIYNQDAPESLLLGVPQLYSQGRLGLGYGSHSFLINMIDSLYQAAIIFFLNALVYEHSDTGIYEFGVSICHNCLIAQLLHIAIETNSWNILSIGSLVISYLTFIVFSVLYTVACNGCLKIPNMVGEFSHVIFSGVHWLVVLVATVLALLPRYTINALQVSLRPSDVTTALLLEKQQKNSISSSPTICRVICSSPTPDSNDAMNSLVTMTSLIPPDDSDT